MTQPINLLVETAEIGAFERWTLLKNEALSMRNLLKGCRQKRLTKGKREGRKMEWKKGHMGDLFLYSISALSLFSLPNFDDIL
jgi:hypothetical protein